MYLNLKEAADYLDLPEAFILKSIQEGRIRAIHDGEQYLVNKNHFDAYLEQMKKLKERFAEEQNEPIPEDYDVKDED
jgi:excisionase family DNA binding protein